MEIDLVLLGFQIIAFVLGNCLVYAIMTAPVRKDYCPSCKESVEFEYLEHLVRMKCKTCGYEMGCLKWKLHYRGQG